MYSYLFPAHFVCNQFDVSLLTVVIPAAVRIYNALPRKAGHRKSIAVSINPVNKCLDITLTSDIRLAPINYLRAAQYFSKVLALQPGMSGYIADGRLLVQ